MSRGTDNSSIFQSSFNQKHKTTIPSLFLKEDVLLLDSVHILNDNLASVIMSLSLMEYLRLELFPY